MSSTWHPDESELMAFADGELNSVEKSRVLLWTDWSTTATTTWSKIAAERSITSRWPLVMGSKVPGQTAMLGELMPCGCGSGCRRSDVR